MNNACSPLYRRYRFPAEIIAEAVWLYFRFPLSFRMVEDVLAYKGIVVTHKTIRQWAEKFGKCQGSQAFDPQAALSHCLKYSRAKSQAPFSGSLAAYCFPFGHGMQALLRNLCC